MRSMGVLQLKRVQRSVGARPLVTRGREQQVDDRHERRGEDEGPQEAVRAEPAEVDVGGADRATSVAKSTRPARESGVVFGSEIMKKVKSRNAPLSSRCQGMASGSPRKSDRVTTRPA